VLKLAYITGVFVKKTVVAFFNVCFRLCNYQEHGGSLFAVIVKRTVYHTGDTDEWSRRVTTIITVCLSVCITGQLVPTVHYTAENIRLHSGYGTVNRFGTGQRS
jgi:hypothetical protein